MENRKYIYIKEESFENIKDGIKLARNYLKGVQKISKPFLKNHKEYKETYSITIGKIKTNVEYKIYKLI